MADTISQIIEQAAAETNTSPTQAQIASGNYRKGRFRFRGLQFVIENPIGSARRGTSPDGTEWSNVLHHHYGYVSGTEGCDGDQVDVFIGPDIQEPIVYVINQTDQDGAFDETKSMIGFSDAESARSAYLKHYPRDWNGLHSVVPMPFSRWKEWVMSDSHTSPAEDQMFRTEFEYLEKSDLNDGPLYVYGAVLVPDKFDRQGDIIDADAIKKAARNYMAKAQHAGLQHKWLLSKSGIQLTQSFLAPTDMTIGKKDIPKGSWVVEFQVTDDNLKKSIASGEYRAFSIGGRAKRVPVD